MASPTQDGGALHSPAYHPSSQIINYRQFKGCSRITDYRILNKIGEGTFG